MVKRKAGRFGHRGQIGVVGGDGDQLTAEGARTPAEDQVVEAVPQSRDHHQDPLRCLVVDRVFGAQTGGEMIESRRQLL